MSDNCGACKAAVTNGLDGCVWDDGFSRTVWCNACLDKYDGDVGSENNALNTQEGADMSDKKYILEMTLDDTAELLIALRDSITYEGRLMEETTIASFRDASRQAIDRKVRLIASLRDILASHRRVY